MKGETRIADCGLRMGLAGLALLPATVIQATTNELASRDAIPPLRPPKAEILPSFWEQHGILVSLATVGCLVALVVFWRMLSRPRPPVIPAPATVARQNLQVLREREENRELLATVSSVLRDYFIAVFGLPHEQFTNGELCRQLASHPQAGSELAASVTALLQGMEHRRFNTGEPPQSRAGIAPVSPFKGREASESLAGRGVPSLATGKTDALGSQAGSLSGAVEEALRLIDLTERQRQAPPNETAGVAPQA